MNVIIKKSMVYMAFLAIFPVQGFAQEATLSDLISSAPEVRAAEKGEDFTLAAVFEMGFAYGARGGLAYESARIAEVLESRKLNLDRVFNFQPLMMPGNIVPPVLTMTTDTFDLKNHTHVVLADAVYRIERPARFRSHAPTWRDYLMRTWAHDRNASMGWNPRNDAERRQWERAVKEGWQSGVRGAHEMFEANLARLSRDLSGMILYRQLHARNMVTEPMLSHSELGVTGNATELNINEAVLVIRSPSEMNLNPGQWRAVR